MSIRALPVLIAAVLLSGCLGSLNDSITPPPPRPAPPVVGHWLLDAPANVAPESLWIESDGTYAEKGAMPMFSADSISSLKAGTWEFIPPTLIMHDVQNGDYSYLAIIGRDGGMLIRGRGRSWSFHPEPADAGTSGG